MSIWSETKMEGEIEKKNQSQKLSQIKKIIKRIKTKFDELKIRVWNKKKINFIN